MTVYLHTSALAAHAHDAIVLPWLRDVARAAARTSLPTVVAVPLRADAYYLKGRALSAGIHLFGVHFLTPSDLRDRLLTHHAVAVKVPLREHLHLLLATAAERVRDRQGDAILAGVAASPDQLLKAIDLIGSGGWHFAEAGPYRLRAVDAEFQKLPEVAGFSLMHDVDRLLLSRPPRGTPAFGQLLLTGFNAAHWSLWPLLEAVVRNAESATVCLVDPRTEAEDLDAAWIGTWEEAFGAAEPVGADFPSAPLADLLRAPELATGQLREPEGTAGALKFLTGEDTAEQARAVVAQALQFLATPGCERLGILFPGAGALSRRVADLLAEHEVPHHDGLAHRAPGPMEDASWPAWLALQETPRLPALLRFLQTRPEGSFGELSNAEAASELLRVYQELLLDDLAVLTEFLASHSPRQHAPALAAGLRNLPVLPETASIAEFIAASRRIFQQFSWKERVDELDRLAADWHLARAVVVSRQAWVRWLGETQDSWRTERSSFGRHPYGRLHLLPYNQAESQSWSYLIAAGLNENQWPPGFEDTGLLDAEETDALNRRLWTLNQDTLVQGRQGEGHIAVPSGRAFCLGTNQRRALASRQFFNTLESVTTAVALSVQLHDEATPNRLLNPGEFFLQLYYRATGRSAGQETIAAIREVTAAWLDAGELRVKDVQHDLDLQSTRHAYDERRRPGVAFGEYGFALSKPPVPPIRLAAKQWEDALAAPALVWMDAVLGVTASGTDAETPWALAQGNWVHDWMRSLSGHAPSGTFIPLPSPADLRITLHKAATSFRDRVAASLQDAPLPEWWESSWEQSYGTARQLTDSVGRVTGRSHLGAEWKLGEKPVPIAGGELYLRGRIDLLLSTDDSLQDVWLVDYKTGNRKPLRLSDLEAGDGVQLALYGLSLRALGAGRVGLSLLTPWADLDQPQLDLDDVIQLTSLWDGLLRMQDTGIFGQHGALREEFGFASEYPLATLAIDPELLTDKWQHTHPAFSAGAGEDEEEESLS